MPADLDLAELRLADVVAALTALTAADWRLVRGALDVLAEGDDKP